MSKKDLSRSGCPKLSILFFIGLNRIRPLKSLFVACSLFRVVFIACGLFRAIFTACGLFRAVFIACGLF